ncbi:MAG TPA: aldehyde dehydrogenase family protein [Steroidobacteraceae bacterium]|jgi:phenylacetaldehyde dehydrogenase|nr:aldehyde dehydrogenase family protein [Steroidobacteraceae bacterium]
MNAVVKPDLQAQTAGFIAKTHRLFINNEWVEPESGKTIDVINPATGKVFAQVAAAGASDVDRAVRAARAAFESGPWPIMPPVERSKLLWKLADAIEAAADEIGYILSLDNGMPMMMAKFAGALGTARGLRYLAGWCGKIDGAVPTVSEPNKMAYTLREPVGVIGAITPWNFPFAMEADKIGQAMAAGCTIVLKPAELTPLGAMLLGRLVQEAGIPPGVVNIVTGYGDPAGKALVEHPDVDKVTFTGSTATGKWIVQAAAATLKRVTLELGGKSPTFIFPDADLEKAIPGAAMAVFANAGQICVAGSRLYVHRKVFDRVVAGVTGLAKALKVGPGLSPDTQMGPLVSQGQLDRVSGYIQSGRTEGAQVVVGGERQGSEGYFLQPTVLAQTDRSMRVMREEIFGPVICAMPMDDDDLDRIAKVANDTTYGLSAYIWTRDVGIAHKLARKIKAGTVQINGGVGLDPAVPFGGYKQSGWGRERGRDGVESMLETKAVGLSL